MQDNMNTDALVQKAIDGEPMSDKELRDFAAASIASQELAEEFALTRRIVMDAASLPRLEPSAGFVGRVMQALEAAPTQAVEAASAPTAQSAPAAAAIRWGWGLGAAFALGAVLCVAWLGPGVGTQFSSETLLWADWEGWLATAWAPVEAILESTETSSLTGSWISSVLWLAIVAPGVAVALNLWSLRERRFER